MYRIVRSIVIALCASLSCGAYASGAEMVQVAAKRTPQKKIKAKKKPLKPVAPSIDKSFTPKLFSSIPMRLAIAAYQDCMYSEGDTTEERLDRALRLNLEYRNEKSLHGNPQKLGREVCLAEALGLGRFETQEEINGAKGTELFPISPEFVLIPDDMAPPERRFARIWVKDYVEGLGRDLHAYLAERYKDDIAEAKDHGETFALEKLRVNSLVRAIADQNAQASPAKCKNEICSTHLTGSTVDISNNNAKVSREVLDWIRRRLIEDRKNGKIVMIQEIYRPHYHIFVIPPEYLPKTWE